MGDTGEYAVYTIKVRDHSGHKSGTLRLLELVFSQAL